MKFTIRTTCPKCKKYWEQNVHIRWRSDIINGLKLEDVCDYCGHEDENFDAVVVGIWNIKTHETDYSSEKELLDIWDEKN